MPDPVSTCALAFVLSCYLAGSVFGFRIWTMTGRSFEWGFFGFAFSLVPILLWSLVLLTSFFPQLGVPSLLLGVFVGLGLSQLAAVYVLYRLTRRSFG